MYLFLRNRYLSVFTLSGLILSFSSPSFAGKPPGNPKSPKRHKTSHQNTSLTSVPARGYSNYLSNLASSTSSSSSSNLPSSSSSSSSTHLASSSSAVTSPQLVTTTSPTSSLPTASSTQASLTTSTVPNNSPSELDALARVALSSEAQQPRQAAHALNPVHPSQINRQPPSQSLQISTPHVNPPQRETHSALHTVAFPVQTQADSALQSLAQRNAAMAHHAGQAHLAAQRGPFLSSSSSPSPGSNQSQHQHQHQAQPQHQHATHLSSSSHGNTLFIRPQPPSLNAHATRISLASPPVQTQAYPAQELLSQRNAAIVHHSVQAHQAAQRGPFLSSSSSPSPGSNQPQSQQATHLSSPSPGNTLFTGAQPARLVATESAAIGARNFKVSQTVEQQTAINSFYAFNRIEQTEENDPNNSVVHLQQQITFLNEALRIPYTPLTSEKSLPEEMYAVALAKRGCVFFKLAERTSKEAPHYNNFISSSIRDLKAAFAVVDFKTHDLILEKQQRGIHALAAFYLASALVRKLDSDRLSAPDKRVICEEIIQYTSIATTNRSNPSDPQSAFLISRELRIQLRLRLAHTRVHLAMLNSPVDVSLLTTTEKDIKLLIASKNRDGEPELKLPDLTMAYNMRAYVLSLLAISGGNPEENAQEAILVCDQIINLIQAHQSQVPYQANEVMSLFFKGLNLVELAYLPETEPASSLRNSQKALTELSKPLQFIKNKTHYLFTTQLDMQALALYSAGRAHLKIAELSLDLTVQQENLKNAVIYFTETLNVKTPENSPWFTLNQRVKALHYRGQCGARLAELSTTSSERIQYAEGAEQDLICATHFFDGQGCRIVTDQQLGSIQYFRTRTRQILREPPASENASHALVQAPALVSQAPTQETLNSDSIEALRNEISSLQNRCSATDVRCVEVGKWYDTIQTRCETLMTQHSDLQDSTEQLRTENESLKKRCSATDVRCVEVGKHYETIHARCETLMTQHSDLQGTTEQLRTENENLRSICEQLQKRMTDLEANRQSAAFSSEVEATSSRSSENIRIDLEREEVIQLENEEVINLEEDSE